MNDTSRSIMVTNCWSGGTTHEGFYPPCTTNYNPYADNSWMYLAPNDTTYRWYYYYDTDAVQFQAGCLTYYLISGNAGTQYADRRGKGYLWRKISNPDTLTVLNILC